MERSEFPTAQRLLELRLEGETPYSPWATACVKLAAVGGILLWFAWPGSGEVLRAVALISEWRGGLLPWGALKELGQELGRELLMVAASAALVGLLFGMLQRRFLVQPGKLVVQPERLNPFYGVRVMGLGGRVLAGVLLLGFVVGIEILAVRLVWGGLFHSLSAERVSLVGLWSGVSSTLFAPLVVLCGGAAALAWGFSWCSFMLKHRMTRKEKLQEGGV